MRKLNQRQELFCYEYLKDFNARKAAIRAGYSESTAAVSGSRNLAHAGIATKLRELIEERKVRLQISADYVLRRFLEIDQLDIATILDAEGNVLPIEQWTEDWRRSVAAIDIQELKADKALVKKIKLPDKLRNLELIGKHIDVSAFKDRIEDVQSDNRELVIYVSAPRVEDDLNVLKQSLIEK